MIETPIPRNDTAERVVLGALLIDNDLVHEVSSILRPSDFMDRRAQDTYKAIHELVDKGSLADLITVKDHLGNRADVTYLADLISGSFKAAKVAHYARIIKEKSTLRALARSGEKIMSLALRGIDSTEVLEIAEREIFAVGDSIGNKDFVAIGDTVKRTMDMLDSMTSAKGLTGLSTGFFDIDSYTGGFQKGELYILAARPGMGKTALALNILRNVALKGGTVGMFSMEMSIETLNLRILCSAASVDSMLLKTGNLPEKAYYNLTDALSEFERMDIHFNDQSGVTIAQIASSARRMKKRHGLDLLVIDYIQLMSGGPRSGGNRQQQISDISRALKGIARELECPVLALSQLSRACESREDHRPILSDLRESGAIEQDADVVIGLYRDEVYDKKVDNENLAEIIFLKQRNGRIGSETMVYLKEFTRFETFNPWGVPQRDDGKDDD